MLYIYGQGKQAITIELVLISGKQGVKTILGGHSE